MNMYAAAGRTESDTQALEQTARDEGAEENNVSGFQVRGARAEENFGSFLFLLFFLFLLLLVPPRSRHRPRES